MDEARDTVTKIPVGVSSCLLGQPVRYNGGHKHHHFINKRLVDFFEFRPYCPEVAIGLGVPRTPIRLARAGGEVKVINTKDHTIEVTRELRDYGAEVGANSGDLCGYIFKAKSPSCGMERVKVYNLQGTPLPQQGVGVFAAEVMRALPSLPVEEEGRLNDPDLRENFITRVFTRYRWRQAMRERPTAAKLVDFHTRHKLLVMAHNQAAYRRLGRIVACAGAGEIERIARQYESELMHGLKRHASRKSHANVLQHLQGFFSRDLSPADRRELARLIEDYRLGLTPLAAPLTLIRHHLAHHPNAWALSQTYLQPYPPPIAKPME